MRNIFNLLRNHCLFQNMILLCFEMENICVWCKLHYCSKWCKLYYFSMKHAELILRLSRRGEIFQRNLFINFFYLNSRWVVKGLEERINRRRRKKYLTTGWPEKHGRLYFGFQGSQNNILIKGFSQYVWMFLFFSSFICLSCCTPLLLTLLENSFPRQIPPLICSAIENYFRLWKAKKQAYYFIYTKRFEKESDHI